MKIRILSDLHIELFDFAPPPLDADVVALAGDILPEHYGLVWTRRVFPNTPIIYVLGNHEFYDAHYETVVERSRKEAHKPRYRSARMQSTATREARCMR